LVKTIVIECPDQLHEQLQALAREGWIRNPEQAAVAALRELGFRLTDPQPGEVSRGKDFIQLKNGPFDLDLVFAPDGIKRFADAWSRRVEVEGFPVCHIDDIIASKAATHRQKDHES